MPRWAVTVYALGTVADVKDRLGNLGHLEPVVRDGSDGIVLITVTVNERDEGTAADYAKWAVEREVNRITRLQVVRRAK